MGVKKFSVLKIIISVSVIIIIVVGAIYYFRKETSERFIGINRPWGGSDVWLQSSSPESMVAIKEYTMDIGGEGNGLLSLMETQLGQALLFQKLAESPVADESIFPYGVSWKTVDAVLLPEMEKNDYFAFFCGDHYKYTYPEVQADLGSATTVRVAIAENTNETVLKNIKQAWIANLSTGKLEEISTSGVICHNDTIKPYYP